MCVHYWIIEVPEGPTSTGRCKYCGEVREFSNVWENSYNDNIHRPNTVRIKERELNPWVRDEIGHYIPTDLLP